MAVAVFVEDDLLPLSALQHLLFCERQCALIHIEGLWAENRLTVEGHQLHERADHGSGETRGALRIARGLAVRSLRLGLVGRADIVEFHAGPEQQLERVYPVEYKRGRPKLDRSDEVQLCAQALCLEEMLGTPVAAGALYYGTNRRRTEIAFDKSLREATEVAAARLHALVSSGVTPPALREAKCDSCSLLELCLPAPSPRRRAADAWMDRVLTASLAAQPHAGDGV